MWKSGSAANRVAASTGNRVVPTTSAPQRSSLTVHRYLPNPGGGVATAGVQCVDRKWTGRWGTVFRAAGRPGGGGGEGAPDLDPAASHDRDLTVQVGDLARARGGKGAVPACKAVLAAVFAVCLGEMEIEMEMEKVAPGSACGS